MLKARNTATSYLSLLARRAALLLRNDPPMAFFPGIWPLWWKSGSYDDDPPTPLGDSGLKFNLDNAARPERLLGMLRAIVAVFSGHSGTARDNALHLTLLNRGFQV